MRVSRQYITSPTWRKNKAQHEQQRRAAEQERRLEQLRPAWDMGTKTPMIVTQHKDSGRIPGGVRLQIDDNEASRSVIHRRAARLTGDLNVRPEAILETSLEEITEEFTCN